MSAQGSAETVLKADDIAKDFVVERTFLGRARKKLHAVNGVSFELKAGETLALVGESGCGKSTLGRLVMRLVEPDRGRVDLCGIEVTGLSESAMRPHRRLIQLVYQDPFASLNPRMTIGDMIAEPLRLHAIVPAGARMARVQEILRSVGLTGEHASRFAHELSGGQRQRAAIARALAAEPAVIVCDEPVSALDVSLRSQILNLLQDIQDRLGVAYLFISHDLAVVRHSSQRVAVMYLGRIVETAPTAALFAAPRHPYTRALLATIPSIGVEGQRHTPAIEGELPSPIAPPSGCTFHTRCPFARPLCSEESPPLEIDDQGHATACHFWRELPRAAEAGRAAAIDPRLQRLFDAFSSPRSTAPLEASC